MTSRTRTIIKATLAGGLLVAGIALGISRIRHFATIGEEGVRVWFYDQSEQRLYAVPRETIPPHSGIGGAAGDGVRAIVVACRAEQGDPAKRRIAYLETYTPELKRILEGIRAARAAGRVYEGQIPARDSDFFQKNTLVRRPTEVVWHDVASAAGQKIMAEWRNWSGLDGQPLIVCAP